LEGVEFARHNYVYDSRVVLMLLQVQDGFQKTPLFLVRGVLLALEKSALL
jgi:hypothetical protein